jgi:D-alanine-D-alanine ligase
MPKPSVLVLYNKPVLPRDHPDSQSEYSVIAIAEKIGAILTEEGFRVRHLALESDPAVLWKELTKRKPDVIFNLFEGNPDHAETESYVAGLLEWSGVPYTGSPFATLTLARPKHLAKTLFKGAGLPTADFLVVNGLPMPKCTLTFPVIVKPAAQDASVGLGHDSVCENRAQLERRVRYILKAYGAPVLVEEYIDGREFNVPLMELPTLTALPATEIFFPNPDPDAWPILTYAGKWDPTSPDYNDVDPQLARLPQAELRQLAELAKAAYRLLGCRDYARVDFRMNEAGKFYILEVNPNPEISEYAGFAHSLGSIRCTHREFIVRLVKQALTRTHLLRPTFTPER